VPLRFSSTPTPPDEVASNRLLRALWAALRAEFGKFTWQYVPVRYGSRQTIYFGYADLALPTTIRIGVTYKRRGIIDRSVFEDASGDADLPASRFEHCVRLAERATETEVTISAKILVPYDLQLQSEERPGPFSVLNDTGGTTHLCIRVRAFDEADAAHNFALHINPILDVLSSFTNLFLALGEFTDPPSSPPPQQATSSPSVDWLDGYPVADGLLVIPEICLGLVDDIIRDGLDEPKQQLVDACHHFHAARALEEQSHSFATTQSTAAELVLVLYMSCLEVLSLIGAPPPVTGTTCSQPQHRISARVVEFMGKHNGPAVAQVVKELYNARSKYLHAGRLLSSPSYTGRTIPQLDSSTEDGVRSPVPLVPLLNLREYTSFCIRAVTRELTSAQPGNAPDGASRRG
jgi:hypothetical protein